MANRTIVRFTGTTWQPTVNYDIIDSIYWADGSLDDSSFSPPMRPMKFVGTEERSDSRGVIHPVPLITDWHQGDPWGSDWSKYIEDWKAFFDTLPKDAWGVISSPGTIWSGMESYTENNYSKVRFLEPYWLDERNAAGFALLWNAYRAAQVLYAREWTKGMISLWLYCGCRWPDSHQILQIYNRAGQFFESTQNTGWVWCPTSLFQALDLDVIRNVSFETWLHAPEKLFYRVDRSTPGYRGGYTWQLIAKKPYSKPRAPLRLPFSAKPPVYRMLRMLTLKDLPRKKDTPKQIRKAENYLIRVNARRMKINAKRLHVFNQKTKAYEARRTLYEEIADRKMARYQSKMRAYEAYLKTPFKRVKGERKPAVKTNAWNPLSELTIDGLKSSQGVSFYEKSWGNSQEPLDLPSKTYVGSPSGFQQAGTIHCTIGANLDNDVLARELFDLVYSWCRPDINQLLERNRTVLQRKMANVQVHFGNMIAESRQTASMLHDATLALVNFIKGKRSLFSLPRRLSSMLKKDALQVSNLFLQFKFGLEPLVGDLNNAVRKIANGEQETKCQHKARKQVLIVDSPSGFTGTVSVSSIARYSVSADWLVDLKEVGLLDPSQVAWELAPWSFVCDWFYPVGDFLQRLSSDAGFKDIEVLHSVVISGYYKNVTGEGNVKLKFRYSVPGEIPTAIPKFKNPFSWTHSLEALALIVQKAFKRG